jgi:cytochrome P450
MPGTEQSILADKLREAAQPVADYARASSARWSRRVPASVRLQGGASRITIAAGGARAPQAYTFEGRESGAPIAHPVYGHGPRETWTWRKQIPVRPFLREAIDATEDQVVEIFSGIVDDWTEELGYK